MKNNRYIGYIEDIAKLSSELLEIYKDEMKEGIDNARFDEEEEFLRQVYAGILSSNEKMMMNAIALLLLNGKVPVCNDEDYRKASVFTVETNGTTYSIKKEELKNILGKDYNQTMDELLGTKQNVPKDKTDKGPKKPKIQNLGEKIIKEKNITQPKKSKENKNQKVEVQMESNPKNTKENNSKSVKQEKLTVDFPEPTFSLDEIEDEYNDILLDEEPVIKKETKPPITLNKNLKKQNKLKQTEEPPKPLKQEKKSEPDVLLVEPTLVDKSNPEPKRNPAKDNDIMSESIVAEIPDETEIQVIEDDKQVIDSVSINNGEEEISPNDMVVDEYRIDYKDKDGTVVKTVSILVTPLHFELEDCFMTQIMVLAKSGNEIIPFVSDDINRPSVQVKINSESLIVRGSWVSGNFQTILYPQNNSDYNIVKKIKSTRPEMMYNCGHNIKMINDDIIHVFPLASQNSEDGYVNVMVCLENKKNNLYKIEKSSHTKITEIGAYKVSAKWENGKLISLISDV